MTFNTEALAMNYIAAETFKEKEEVLNMLPLFMQNHYTRETLEKLEHEHNTLQFPAYNLRFAEFTRRVLFALKHNLTPRGFVL